MASFRSGETDWRVALTAGHLGRLKREADFDVAAAARSEDLLGELLCRDVVRLLNVVWVLVGPQARALGVAREAFEDTVTGEVLEAAAVALVEAMIDFFHPGRSAAIKSRLPALRDKANAAAGTAAAAHLDRILEGPTTPTGSSAPAGASPASAA